MLYPSFRGSVCVLPSVYCLFTGKRFRRGLKSFSLYGRHVFPHLVFRSEDSLRHIPGGLPESPVHHNVVPFQAGLPPFIQAVEPGPVDGYLLQLSGIRHPSGTDFNQGRYLVCLVRGIQAEDPDKPPERLPVRVHGAAG